MPQSPLAEHVGAVDDVSVVLARDALSEILEFLAAQPTSPTVREWRVKAWRYERTLLALGDCNSQKVESQVLAIYDCVMELRALVMGASASATVTKSGIRAK